MINFKEKTIYTCYACSKKFTLEEASKTAKTCELCQVLRKIHIILNPD